MKVLRYLFLRLCLLLVLWMGFVSCGEQLGPSEKPGNNEAGLEQSQRETLTEPADSSTDASPMKDESLEPDQAIQEEATNRDDPAVKETPTDTNVAEKEESQKEGGPEVIEPTPELSPEPTPPRSIALGSGVSLSPIPEAGKSVTIRYKGQFANRANLTLHYGFNGWDAVQGLTQTEQDDGVGNKDYYQQAPMKPMPVSQGPGFEVTIVIPQQARSLHMVFFTTLNQAQEWDNNQSQDFNVGVLFPYIGPYLTWNGSTKPESGVVVSFVSGPSCTGEVSYGTTQALGQTVQGSANKRYHHIKLSNLQADTVYFYKVSCVSGRDSKVYSFRTAPVSPTKIRFGALADMQDNGETGRWKATANELMANHKDLHFFIVSGDLAWNDRPGLWWSFFDKGRELFASKVMMPVPGNHDTPTVGSSRNTSSFEKFFDLPKKSGSSTYFQFRYGPVLFVGMNSEYASDFNKNGGKQYTWVQSVLASPSPKPTWTFAYAHHPSYNVGSRHWGIQGMYRDITTFFDGKVDWVFYGHEHMYQRMKPLRFNATLVPKYGTQAGQGVGYMILPPAGAWPNANLIDSQSSKAYYRNRLAYPVPKANRNDVSSENGFVRVELNGRTFTLKTYGLGTFQAPKAVRLLDQHSYTK